MINKIIYYYQTFTGLHSILNNPITTTHIIVSSIHFGKDSKQTPYIHLNNYKPDNKQFISVWNECKQAHDKGITIMIMVGGAGGAYEVLFSNFELYYPMLKKLIQTYPYIKGIDLDIEESVSIKNVKKLINQITMDFGKEFIISMAPIASSLTSNYPGLGGFIYKDLIQSPEGQLINWFNGQFYFQYTKDIYDNCILNGYKPEQIVFGMIANIYDFDDALEEIKLIKQQYPTFGGVFVWEYFNCPPDPKNPNKWSELISKQLQ